MAALLGLHNLAKSYGTQELFEDLSFTIHEGDHIVLIGPNGSGKSTLLKILAGLEKPDSGSLSARQGLRIGYASQAPDFPDLTIEEFLAPQGCPEAQRTRARILLSRALFTDTQQKASALSGGWKKRLDIVRALMSEPDLLLLDEPTNHLDLEGILWLEQFLAKERVSYLVVSHDRYFLNKIASKVIELNSCYKGGLFLSEGNMNTFTERKEAYLDAQIASQKGLASTVRHETAWLKSNAKARTTKSRSRIDKANALIDELASIKQRNRTRSVNLTFNASERETRHLLVAKNIAKSLGGKELFSGVDIKLSPGTRLGIVGKNGTGKTTLLRTLAKLTAPDRGTLKYAEDLRLVYFDQHREQIDPNLTLREALSPNGDYVSYHGQSIHVSGWAKRFLFGTDRLEIPIHCLSGGERARILIARLMLQPADILFLDEPTNDLDIPTLEVIEEGLREFAGAVVLITHDRCLMDRVCNQILGLGENNEQQLFADYAQWERTLTTPKSAAKEPPKPAKPPVPIKKLSYKEQLQLQSMERNISQTEERIEKMQQELDAPEIHADGAKSLEAYRKLALEQDRLEALYKLWQELEDRGK